MEGSRGFDGTLKFNCFADATLKSRERLRLIDQLCELCPTWRYIHLCERSRQPGIDGFADKDKTFESE